MLPEIGEVVFVDGENGKAKGTVVSRSHSIGSSGQVVSIRLEDRLAKTKVSA